MTGQQIKTLLYVHSDSLSLTVRGRPVHSDFSPEGGTGAVSSLAVRCTEPFEVLFAGNEVRVSDPSSDGYFLESVLHRPLFFENENYEFIIEALNGHRVEFRHENPEIRNSVSPIGNRSSVLSGIVCFGNDIGFSDLCLRVDGVDCLTLTLEVFPSVIGYKEDYLSILSDVSSEMYRLTYDFLRKTYRSYESGTAAPNSPVEFFSVIRSIFERFLAAADLAAARPLRVLSNEHRVLPACRAKRTDGRSIRWLEKHPQNILRSGDSFAVRNALAADKRVTFDTKENRFVKFVLQDAADRLLGFRKLYVGSGPEPDVFVLRDLDKMVHELRLRANRGFLREIVPFPSDPGSSLVFGMAPGYRELYRCHLLLQRGLSVSGMLFRLSIKELPVLYEYWCFIQLNRLLRNRFRLVSQDIIRVDTRGLSVSLIQGRNGFVRYLDPVNGDTASLFFHPSFQNSLLPLPQPSQLLSLKRAGSPAEYRYIFDVKYRINPAAEGGLYRSLYGTPGPEDADIGALHRFRDAAISENEASVPERGIIGAYLLFPGRDSEEYRRHPFYRSIETVDIGALPFLPSETEAVSRLLEKLITVSPEAALHRTALPPGIRDRLDRVDWSRRDVLIGTFRSIAQFDICKSRRFYYVPCSRLSEEDLPVRWIAMFQTPAVFSPSEAGISFFGEVLRTALVKRKSIKEVPLRTDSDPEELYYRFQIREWLPLKKRILPKGAGFVSALTNPFLLRNAEFVPELLLRSAEAYRFYSELKRLCAEASSSENRTVPGFSFRDCRVFLQDGQLLVVRNNRVAEHCSAADFNRNPVAAFRMLSRGMNLEKTLMK